MEDSIERIDREQRDLEHQLANGWLSDYDGSLHREFDRRRELVRNKVNEFHLKFETRLKELETIKGTY